MISAYLRAGGDDDIQTNFIRNFIVLKHTAQGPLHRGGGAAQLAGSRSIAQTSVEVFS